MDPILSRFVIIESSSSYLFQATWPIINKRQPDKTEPKANKCIKSRHSRNRAKKCKTLKYLTMLFIVNCFRNFVLHCFITAII